MNQYETESLASCFCDEGFSVADFREPAELYVVNTCTVTSKSEQKARRIIRKLAADNPGSLVVVTGCYAQLAGHELRQLAPNLFVVPQESKQQLFSLAEDLGANPGFFSLSPGEKMEWLATRGISGKAEPDPFAFTVEKFLFHSRAFCKIQDGCDNRCSYCRVPLARGGGISLHPDEVCRRVAGLAESGYREVVVTGVNICAYRSQGLSLADLMKRLLDENPGLRFRLSSLEPDRITPELANLLENPGICPHFHLPLQSGSDFILQKMKRRYRVEDFRRGVALLKNSRPGAFLAADVIVGFPGETEADFRQTCTLVEEFGFAGLHIFPFSPRPGTLAFDYKPAVPPVVRKERAAVLKKLGEKLAVRYLANMEGREVSLVLENEDCGEKGFWQGLSENYLKVRVPVQNFPFRRGALIKARITGTGSVCYGMTENP